MAVWMQGQEPSDEIGGVVSVGVGARPTLGPGLVRAGALVYTIVMMAKKKCSLSSGCCNGSIAICPV